MPSGSQTQPSRPYWISRSVATREFAVKVSPSKSSLEGIVSNQREMERVLQEWMSRAGWGTMVPGAGLGARAEAKRDGGEPDPERLREEVSALRERLKSLEERLERRKAQPK